MQSAREKLSTVTGWRVMGYKGDWEPGVDRNIRRLLWIGGISVKSCLVRSGQLIWRSWESIPESKDGICKGPEAQRSLVFWGARMAGILKREGERESSGRHGWRGMNWTWILNPASWIQILHWTTKYHKPWTHLSKCLEYKEEALW